MSINLSIVGEEFYIRTFLNANFCAKVAYVVMSVKICVTVVSVPKTSIHFMLQQYKFNHINFHYHYNKH